MPASEAQIRANQANSKRSSGPRDTSRTRANATKHGMCASVCIPEQEAAEVDRRYLGFCEELQPDGEVSMALARQATILSVRTERCFEQENATLAELARRADAEFVAPEGVDVATAAKLREETVKRALFDSSKEGNLARRYETAARRGFFQALKELRQLKKAAKVAEEVEIDRQLASFGAGTNHQNQVQNLYAQVKSSDAPVPSKTPDSTPSYDLEGLLARLDIPFSIGKPPQTP